MPTQSAINLYNVGYLQKRSQAKQWIVTDKDLESMYAQSGEDISLWCDHRVDPKTSPGTKRSSGTKSTDEAPPAKRGRKSTNYAEREDSIEEIATELKKNTEISIPILSTNLGLA